MTQENKDVSKKEGVIREDDSITAVMTPSYSYSLSPEPTPKHEEKAISDEATNTQPEKRDKSLNPYWTYLTEGIFHKWMRTFVVTLGTNAARNPVRWIASVTFLSFALAILGLLTNFETEFDQLVFLTPQGSLPDKHNSWVHSPESGFEDLRVFWLALHSNGDNAFSSQAIRQALTTMESVMTAPDYETVCSQSQYLSWEHPHEPTCRTFSITHFWNHNITHFEDQLARFDSVESQDDFARLMVSNIWYPDGTPVFHEAILGKYETVSLDNDTIPNVIQSDNLDDLQGWYIPSLFEQQNKDYIIVPPLWPETFIVSAKTLVIKIDVPDIGSKTDDLEEQLLSRLGDLQKQWKDTPIQLEYFTLNAYQQEFQRAMNKDLPLVVVLIVIMVSFTCFVFYRRKEKVQSRGLLGFFSFATIGMSLMTGYGIMFLAGVPLTSVGIMIPFVVVGVGLDDTFIITGAYFRRRRDNPNTTTTNENNNGDLHTIMMIQETLDEVGVSISMTTLTTLLCFFLGSISSIPAVRWLCLYAGTTIVVDFIYQITYFIALLTLDERRVQHNRKDFCFWIVIKEEDDDEHPEKERGKDLDSTSHDDKAVNSQDNNMTNIVGIVTETENITLNEDSCHGKDNVEESAHLESEGNQQQRLSAASSVSDNNQIEPQQSFLEQFSSFMEEMFMPWTENALTLPNNESSSGDVADTQDDKTTPAMADVQVEDTAIEVSVDSKEKSLNGNLESHNTEQQLHRTGAAGETVLPSADTSTTSEQQDQQSQSTTSTSFNPKNELGRNFMERFMGWYADRLLQPWAKVVVILVFAVYFAGCTYSTTLLYQEFNVGDYVPEDSFLRSFIPVFEDYTTTRRYIGVYFRNVDQSDPDVQQHMMNYVEELSELPQIGGEQPAFFWVRDFQRLAGAATSETAGNLGFNLTEITGQLGLDIGNLTFNEQIALALSINPVRQIYGQDIVRDEESGNITASRTYLVLRKIDMEDVHDQVDMLMDQREITAAQPLNSPENTVNGDLSFFTLDDMYFFWELYDITVDELIFTTISCVVVVSLVALVCIPHWTAMAFVTPLIIMLYFDLLGTMQYCGIKINSITYFIIVMAIGLLVDFLMHVLLRYYETKGATRNEKVKGTLESVGASILLGGFTTWLGVIPLAFSTTKVFMTVFLSFLAMVTLGCGVGLALLPVLLSIVGPLDSEDRPSQRNNASAGILGNMRRRNRPLPCDVPSPEEETLRKKREEERCTYCCSL